MRYRNVTSLAAFLAILGCTAAMAVDAPEVDRAFEALKTFDWGKDRGLLNPIDNAVIASHGDAAVGRALEIRLAAVLKTDAPRDAKDYVCRKLMVIGTAASVPALAELLADKDLSHMARFALERIPAPEAAQAMRDALPKLTGTLKIGVIGSLGARRDDASVPALAELLCDADATVAVAAAHAMGTIGTSEAAESLGRWLEKTPNGEKESVKKAVVEAGLVCADRCLESGQRRDAILIYEVLGGKEYPRQVRIAAMRGRLAACDSAEKRMETAIQIIMNQDREMRAVGIEQVRDGLKGTEITQEFAAILPKLAPEAQVDLLAALAARGDAAARPAVLEMLKSQDSPTRTAAIQALGPLGEEADVPALSQLAATAAGPEKAAALASLYNLRGQGINAAIVDQWQRVKPPARAELIGVLLARRAKNSVPSLLEAALDADAQVRMAAMTALGELAGPEHLTGVLKGVLKAEAGPEREAAEKAVMFICNRKEDAGQRAAMLLAALATFDPDAQTILLPALGRVGGPAAMKVVEEALADKNSQRRDLGVRALCNWPDASAVAKLLDMARHDDDAGHRLEALRALIRIAALPDKRSDAKRLALLKTAWTLATRDEERNLAIQRAQAVRTIESLRFVVAYLDQPAYAQEACATVVALARHRELREPNKAEFDKALDIVIRIGKNASVVDRAKRYRKGQT